MKILFCSTVFTPSVGGIEHVGALLASQFQRAGHEVVVVTHTPATAPEHTPFAVLRRPTLRALAARVAWSDLVFHNQISLRLAWPLLWYDRPWVVAHHTWLWQAGARRGSAWLKTRLLRRALNVAVSQPLAAALPVPSEVIPNPYADEVFTRRPEITRDRDLVFVGRLVSDKGVALLLQALALLGARGVVPGLSIVGHGPEESALRAQVRALGLQAQVQFVGPLQGTPLAALLNAHRVAVVPSVWEEPFGVVALESMACGCVPLVARSGGLPAAVGRAGRVFEKGSAEDLARGISELLSNSAANREHLAAAPAHLARHRSQRIARRYLQVIEQAQRAHAQSRRLADA